MEQEHRQGRGEPGDPLPDRQDEQANVYRFPRTVALEFGHLSPMPPEGGSWDEWVITRGIAAAQEQDRAIDDRTARYIATWLRESWTSTLRRFADTGAIDVPHIHEELIHRFDGQTEQVQSWINWLGEYCLQRADRGPVEDWRERVADQDRAELEQVRRERVVTVLDDLFADQPDEQIGDVEDRGWFGLMHHDGLPGGWVLLQDEQGFRRVWETDSDTELQDRWSAITAMYAEAQQQDGLPAEEGSDDQGRVSEPDEPSTGSI